MFSRSSVSANRLHRLQPLNARGNRSRFLFCSTVFKNFRRPISASSKAPAELRFRSILKDATGAISQKKSEQTGPSSSSPTASARSIKPASRSPTPARKTSAPEFGSTKSRRNRPKSARATKAVSPNRSGPPNISANRFPKIRKQPSATFPDDRQPSRERQSPDWPPRIPIGLLTRPPSATSHLAE